MRRLSSNLLINPFHRSHSRASLAYEDSPIADDGSFQLKGFRHVAGISDVEGSAVYMGSQYRHSVAGFPHVGNSDVYVAMKEVRPTLSRPPSVAGSLGGDDFASVSRVSAGAFRKGIRRPSEGVTTFNEMDRNAKADDDEDDDVPLASFSRKPDFARNSSALSLSSLRSTAEEEIVRTASPKQGDYNVTRHVRNKAGGSAGSGFVVKSAQTTRPIGRTPSPRLTNSQQNSSISLLMSSPLISKPAQIWGAAAGPVASPIALSPADRTLQDSFAGLPVRIGPSSRPQTPVIASPKPRRSSVSDMPPPLPIKIPTPITDLSSLQAVDQISDEPFIPPMMDSAPSPIGPQSGSSSMGNRKMSFLDEPMRLISDVAVPGITGLWHTIAVKDSSSEKGLIPPVPMWEEDEHQSPVLRLGVKGESSASSSPQSGAEGTRTTLQERLATAARQVQSRPSLAPIDTNFMTSSVPLASKNNDSPISDATASPIHRSNPKPLLRSSRSQPHLEPIASAAPPSSFSRVTGGHRRIDNAPNRGWVSSSDDEVGPSAAGGLPRSRVSTRKPVGPRGPLSSSGTIKRSTVTSASQRTEVEVVKSSAKSNASDGSSSEDEPLASVRSKASRSDLALVPARDVSRTLSPPTSSFRSALTPGTSSPRLAILSPAINPSSSAPSANLHAPPKSIEFDTPGIPGTAKSPVQVARERADEHRKTASPASSQSGLTGDSSNAQLPVTPRDRSIEVQRRSARGSKDERGASMSRSTSGDRLSDASLFRQVRQTRLLLTRG